MFKCLINVGNDAHELVNCQTRNLAGYKGKKYSCKYEEPKRLHSTRASIQTSSENKPLSISK